jgi:hypothetical protein
MPRSSNGTRVMPLYNLVCPYCSLRCKAQHSFFFFLESILFDGYLLLLICSSKIDCLVAGDCLYQPYQMCAKLGWSPCEEKILIYVHPWYGGSVGLSINDPLDLDHFLLLTHQNLMFIDPLIWQIRDFFRASSQVASTSWGKGWFSGCVTVY